ncbi:MFS transporter [Streptomyces sp. NBC_01803]|uniref:MFS transporter n=1 Tax=Streptomyces sp. NBC_01803 TaxID=2975946 RepID=UPI002DD8F1DC|nr:MFS transporter [Streptomyces sp. NBC_01803]WSA44232.1 MFS transporter [Streptomyces sp. NBC_01803]
MAHPHDKTPLVPSPPSRRQAWFMTVLLMLFMALNFWDKAVLGLAAVPIMDELNLSNSTYGLASSSFYLLFTVASILVGLMANKVRSKWVFVVLALLWAVAQVPMLISATLTALFVSRIFMGAAEGPANPLTVHTAHAWFPPERRSLPTALTQIASGIGAITAALFLTWVITEHGWRWAFAATAILSAAWAVVYAILGKDRPADTHPTPADPTAPTAPPAEAAPAVAGDTADGQRVPYRRILLSPTFLGSLAMTFAAAWCLAVVLAWLVPYFVRIVGYDPSEAGNMVIPPNVVSITAILVLGALSGRLMSRGTADRVPLGVFTGATVAAGGVCAVLIPYLGTGFWLVCGVSLAAGLPMVAMTSAYNAVGRICPPAQRGAVLGALYGLYSLGSVGGPYAMGVILDHAPDLATGYHRGFTVLGVIAIAGGLCAALCVNPGRDRGRLVGSVAAESPAPGGDGRQPGRPRTSPAV